MEYRYSVGEWRIGEPKSKSGYRDVPLTEEAIAILKRQKEKLREIKVVDMRFKEFVFLCRKGEPTKIQLMILLCLNCVIKPVWSISQCMC